MGTTTTNYAFYKPEGTEFVDVVDQLNDNLDSIDTNLKRVDDAATAPPRCKVHQVAGSLTTIPNNAWTPLTWSGTDHEDYDTASIHDGASNTDRFTVPSNGSYQVSGKVAIAISGSGIRGTRWTKNGNIVPGSVTIDAPPGASTITRVPTVTTTIACVAGDIIRLEAYQDSGGPLDTSVGSDAGDCSFAEVRKVAAS